MRWQTSKGEISPVLEDKRNEGYYYRLKSYMDIPYKAGIPKGTDTAGNQAENRTGTIEQLAQNVEAVEKRTYQHYYICISLFLVSLSNFSSA